MYHISFARAAARGRTNVAFFGRKSAHIARNWWAFVLGLLILTDISRASSADILRPWEPVDSINLRRLAINQMSPQLWVSESEHALSLSPDGKKFYFIEWFGDLKADSNILELSLFTVADVKAWLAFGDNQPAPKKTFRFETVAGIMDGMSLVRWTADSKAIEFVGTKEDGHSDIYFFEVESGNTTQLTKKSLDSQSIRRDITSYYTANGAVIYFTQEKADPVVPRYPMDPLPRQGGRLEFAGLLPKVRTFAISKLGVKREVSLSEDTRAQVRSVSLSPDGLRAIFVSAEAGQLKYSLYDLTTGSAVAICSAFYEDLTGFATEPDKEIRPSAIWSSDARTVILTNAVIDKFSDRTKASLVCYDVASGRCVMLQPMHVADGRSRIKTLSLTDTPDVILIERENSDGKALSPSGYDLQGQRQVTNFDSLVPSKANKGQLAMSLSVGGLEVVTEQSPEQPYRIIATDGLHRGILSAPDRVLGRARYVSPKLVQWEQDGEMQRGWLTLPSDSVPNVALPLVIQQWSPAFDESKFAKLFLADGDKSGPDARQALVARGFAVLQISAYPKYYDAVKAADYNEIGGWSTADTARSLRKRIDGAVASLAQKGIVDPKRVGLIGFSQLGYWVQYVISHPGEIRLAAAIAADHWDGEIGGYLYASAYNGHRDAPLSQWEAITGGSFWQQPSAWLAEDPGMQRLACRTPILTTLHTGGYLPTDNWKLVLEQMVVGGIWRAGRPADFLYFPDAAHQMKRPRERFEMMNAILDWMSFWLKDEAPSDPERAARWAILRKQQDEVLKTPPPPKGHWQFVPDPVQPEWHPPEESKKEEPKPEPTGANKN